MGLLDTYDKIVANPTHITRDYFFNNDEEDWAFVGQGVFTLTKTVCWIVKDTEENRKMFKGHLTPATLAVAVNGVPTNAKCRTAPFTFSMEMIEFSYNIYTRDLKWEIKQRNVAALISAIGFANTSRLKYKLQNALGGRKSQIIEDVHDIVQLETIICGLNNLLIDYDFTFNRTYFEEI